MICDLLNLIGVAAVDPVLKRAQFNKKVNELANSMGVGGGGQGNGSNSKSDSKEKEVREGGGCFQNCQLAFSPRSLKKGEAVLGPAGLRPGQQARGRPDRRGGAQEVSFGGDEEVRRNQVRRT